MKLKRTIILLLVAIMLPVISKGFEITLNVDKKEVKKGEEFVLSIKNSENVIAGNFEIIYNNQIFDFVEGINIDCAEKEGKIVCIYADISGKGTNEFKVRFKSKKPGKTGDFSICNSKFRTDGKDVSYTDNEIIGINNKIDVKVKNSLKIIIVGIVLIAVILCTYVIFKKKQF